jgi:hypothetical protein
MNAPQRVVRLMAIQTVLAVLGLLSMFPAGCMHELCLEKRQSPARPASLPARDCSDDPECTPWKRRLDSREFDAGVTHEGERLRIGRPLFAGQMQGYDGRVYQKKTCLVHVEGPVCNCDLWESVPSDGWQYTPDLFSRIYHQDIAEFYRLQ